MPLSSVDVAQPPMLEQSGLAVRFGGGDHSVSRPVPVETAINIVYAPVPFAVMMATPQDLEDFAIGFSFTEGIIDGIDDVRRIDVEAVEAGLRLVVTLASAQLTRHLGRSRAMAGRTGCGLCGIDDLANLPVARRPRTFGQPLAISAIQRALAQLELAQPLNGATHAVHAAGFANRHGQMLMVREDVGRHNALDKLIGACLRAGLAASDGCVVITSRCSFEMVEKAAMFGARCIVAISAPTTLAIARAKLHGMGLMAVTRADGGIIFCGAEIFAHDFKEN